MERELARHFLKEYVATGFFSHIQEEHWDELCDHRNSALSTTEEALYDLAGVCLRCGKGKEICECNTPMHEVIPALWAGMQIYRQEWLGLLEHPYLYLDRSSWFSKPLICHVGQACPETGIPKVWRNAPGDLTALDWRIK